MDRTFEMKILDKTSKNVGVRFDSLTPGTVFTVAEKEAGADQPVYMTVLRSVPLDIPSHQYAVDLRTGLFIRGGALAALRRRKCLVLDAHLSVWPEECDQS